MADASGSFTGGAGGAGGNGSNFGGGGGGGGYGGVVTVTGGASTIGADFTGGNGGMGGSGNFEGGRGGYAGAGVMIIASTGANTITFASTASGVGGMGGGQDGAVTGAGGSGVVVTNNSTDAATLILDGTATGGAGGLGVNGASTGVGGSGLVVWAITGKGLLTADVNATVTGGTGGATSGASPYLQGGTGGAGIVATNITNGEQIGATILNINANVSGGAGGSAQGDGGSGGPGGSGISAVNSTIYVAGGVTVSGGAGAEAQGDVTYGDGGAGIFGTRVTLVLTGTATVQGGLSGDGNTRAEAIHFGQGSNILELRADADGNLPTILGQIASDGDTNVLALGGSFDATVSADALSQLSSAFSAINKTGTSTWTLTDQSGSSTPWTISQGTLSISTDGALGGDAASLALTGGTLAVTETMSMTRAVTVAAEGGTLSVADGKILTIDGALAGSGALTKSGTGTLTLGNINDSYTGAVAVSAGTLALRGSGGLSNASSVMLGAATTLDISGTTTGATINNLTSSDASASVLLGSQALTLNASTTSAFAGVISGEGALTKTGIGTLILMGENTYTGGTTISEGALQLGNGGTTGSIQGNVTNNASLIFNRSDTYTFPGTITGSGTVTFEGGGTVLFETPGAYSGAITVTNATLTLENGSQSSSVFTVANGGVIKGNGEIGGLVLDGGGIAAPGNSPGTINVVGAVAFNSGSIYRVDVTLAGAHDLITATGAVTINSGAVVQVVAQPGQYAPTSRYAIITTTGTVTGTFGQVTTDYAFLTPSLSYDAQNVYLVLNYFPEQSFASLAQTPNQAAAATAVQALGLGNAVFDAVIQQTAASVPGAYNALSGEAYASTGTMIQQQAVYVRDAVGSRLMQSLTAPGVSPLAYGAGPQTAALGEGLTPTLWAQGYGGWGNSFSNGNAASISNSIGGFLIGADVALAPNVRAGLFGGFSQSQFDVTDRSSTGSMNNVDLGVYAGAQFGAFALRGGASYTWHDVSLNRTVAFPGFSQAVEGGYNTGTTQVFGEVGYDFAVGAYAFEPFAGLAYVNVAGASLQESGGSAALSVATSGMDTVYSTLGLRVATTMQVWGSTLTPHATVGWQHAFGDTTPTSTMQFLGGTTPFSVSGVPIAEDAVLLQAGLTYALSSKASLGASYTSQLASTAAQNAFTAQFALRF